MLLHFTEQFQRGYTGFKRFDEIMNITPEIMDAPDAAPLPATTGKVRYDNVSFSYEKGIDVLKNISLELSPGRTVALVGSSGGGKSTICALLPRFYDVKSGSITVDGQAVSDFGSSGNGESRVEIHGGVGAINVKFKE